MARERHGWQRSLTIGDLVAGTDALAAGLAAAGATPERPIVCWLPNRLEWLQLIAAAARLGVPIIGLNTRYRADELRHALQRSGAGVLVAVDEFAGIRFGPMAADAGAGSLQSVVVVGAERDPAWDDVGCAVLAWDELDRDGPVDHEPVPEDLLVAFTTSGTTGLPKLAVHDQGSAVRHSFDIGRAYDIRPGDRLLLDVPLCGTFGFTPLLAAIAGWRPDAHRRALRSRRLGNGDRAGGRHALQRQRRHAAAHRWRPASCDRAITRCARSGSPTSPTPRQQAATAIAALGVRPAAGVYGSSEVFALLTRWPATMTLAERARSGGVRISPATELDVVDPDTGISRAIGEEGELRLRGPTICAATSAIRRRRRGR